ncbi:MAG: NAD(P)-dependent oxidoreductase, partial [Oscillospiraceae bacterium]|nr:NAD(P)-dependent oxidoreductase [Oscillospiraceae bacterium]
MNSEKKHVLITGADGFVGSNLISLIMQETDWNVTGVAVSQENLENQLRGLQAYDPERIGCIPISEVRDGKTELPAADILLHLAFSRRMKPNADIASSIDFAAAVCRAAKKAGIPAVINLSSQGVYGDTEEIRTEKTVPAPNSVYTTAKYASEKVFEAYFTGTDVRMTQLRLDPIVQSQNLVQALCKQAKQDGRINLRGGKQVFSYIDISDAVRALFAMLKYEGDWKPVYNIGLNHFRITLTELAERIAACSEQVTGKPVEIVLDAQDIAL